MNSDRHSVCLEYLVESGQVQGKMENYVSDQYQHTCFAPPNVSNPRLVAPSLRLNLQKAVVEMICGERVAGTQ